MHSIQPIGKNYSHNTSNSILLSMSWQMNIFKLMSDILLLLSFFIGNVSNYMKYHPKFLSATKEPSNIAISSSSLKQKFNTKTVHLYGFILLRN